MHCPSCDGTGQLDLSKLPLGERLRRLREHHNYSLRQVEEATGVSNAGLSQIETGKSHEPSFNRIMALCQFYQIKPEVEYPRTFYTDLNSLFCKPCPARERDLLERSWLFRYWISASIHMHFQPIPHESASSSMG